MLSNNEEVYDFEMSKLHNLFTTRGEKRKLQHIRVRGRLDAGIFEFEI
jgi:hypothetical protein